MRISNIEDNKVLPTPQEVLRQQVKEMERSGKRPRLSLRCLNVLRQYEEQFKARELEKLADIKSQYGDEVALRELADIIDD